LYVADIKHVINLAEGWKMGRNLAQKARLPHDVTEPQAFRRDRESGIDY
jgi:hypothetical protein